MLEFQDSGSRNTGINKLYIIQNVWPSAFVEFTTKQWPGTDFKSINMDTFITRLAGARKNVQSSFSKSSRRMALAALALSAVLATQSWTFPEKTGTGDLAGPSELAEARAWNSLSAFQMAALYSGATVENIDLGICSSVSGTVTVDISSGPAPSANNNHEINTRRPRRWGNGSFYLARERTGTAGVEYCFDFSEPVAFSMDSRDHAYFADHEVIGVRARYIEPVDLTAELLGRVGEATVIGNGGHNVFFEANGTQKGGTWWKVGSNGKKVTQVCIQYFSGDPSAPPSVEPFNLKITGTNCLAQNMLMCNNMGVVSRWNRLTPAQRSTLQIGEPIHNFNTGFCNASGDPINFIEIDANPSPGSGFSTLLSEPPGLYGRHSFDNEGRSNQYCFTLDEAVPVELNSDEHAFFVGTEVIGVTAYLGATPVVLSGYNGATPVNGTVDGITFYGGFGSFSSWSVNSGAQPVTQVCVEYYRLTGNPNGREPFSLSICADRCLYDDIYACELAPSNQPDCTNFPDLLITKEVHTTNDFGLDACNNPGGNVGLPVYEVVLTMSNHGGAVYDLFLEDDLVGNFGFAFVEVLGPPVVTGNGSGMPLANEYFNGIGDIDLIIPGTGGLDFGQYIEVRFSVLLDPGFYGPPNDLFNRAYGGGTDGWFNNYNDLSGSYGHGWGDPTHVQTLPAGTDFTLAQDLSLEATLANYMNGINPWLADNGGAEFSVPGCTVTWTNDYDPNNFVQGCGPTTGSIEVTFMGTASCGFTLTTCAVFTLEDTQGPSCTKPEDLALDCGDPNAAAILADWLDYDGNWTDLSQPVVFTHDFPGIGNVDACSGTPVLVTWTATDACGNESFFDAQLTITDNTAPVIAGVPADQSFDRCDQLPDPANVTASDGCDNDPDLDFNEIQNGTDCNYTLTRTWTATDACGNSTSASQIITVADEAAPEVAFAPADLTVTCPDVPAVEDATFTDCSSFTVGFSEEQIGGNCPVPSQIVRTWTATDECGNVTVVQQVITVEEAVNNGILSFNIDPQDITATCDQNPDFDNVVAETTCPLGGLSTSFDDVVNSNGDCSQPFSVTRTWTAHDACGNLESVSQTINISADENAPIFDANNPTDLMVDCGGDLQFPVAFDNCGPTDLTYEDSNRSGDCATGFSFTRTWTATDLCGNTSTFEQNITTTPDLSPPVFTFVPYDQFFDCDDVIDFGQATAADNCGSVTITFSDEIIGTGDCNEVNGQLYGYDIIRTWTATDECGNTAMAISNAWILPGYNNGNRIAFSYVPDDQSIGCGGEVDFGQAVCHSACGQLALTFEDFSGGDCSTGITQTRVWTATDACGNEIHAEQVIRIDPDEDAPVFSFVPADGTFGCDSANGPVFGTPEVSDNCAVGASLLVTHEDVWENAGDCAAQSVTRTWTAMDFCGNASTASQTLVFEDNTAPVFDSQPAGKTISCGEPVVFDDLNATDACLSGQGGNVDLVFEDQSVVTCEGTFAITRTWTATDACGNAATISQQIRVEDNVPPVFTVSVNDLHLTCNDPLAFDQVEAIDACSNATITYEDEESEGICETVMTRTWTATDACGNSSQLSQTIYIADNEAPVLIGNLPNRLEMTQAEFANWQPPVLATADCSEVTLETATSTESNCDFISYVYEYVATDACGNASSHSLEVLVTDVAMAVNVLTPTEIDCGNAYDLSLELENGTAPFSYSWEVLAGEGWQVSALPGQSVAAVLAGDGDATIKVVVTDAEGCTASQEVTLKCSSETTGVDFVEISGFEIKPNPVSDYLSLGFESALSGRAAFAIVNTLGSYVTLEEKEVLNGGNQFLFDTHLLPAGTYFIVLQMDGKIRAEKFVKTW